MAKLNSSSYLIFYKRLLLYAALFLALLSFSMTHAQDDFPPSGIWIPCCSTGGTGGNTGATYGENGTSAWKQVWGAAPGDKVTFRFVLRSKSAGSLHAWPKSDGASDMTYLGDPNNPYEKWYWNTGQRSSGGTFCIDCPWQFTVPPGIWNPWIYVEYWDSGDGWDVDLNVVNIVTPPPPQLNVVDPQKKAVAHAKAEKQDKWAIGLSVFAASAPIPFWELRLGIALMGAAFKLDAMRLRAVDPWDGDYCTPYDPNYTWYVVDWYEYIPEDSGSELGMVPYINDYMFNASVVDGLQDMIYVSTNRATSAWQAGDYGCSEMQYWRTQWALQTAGDYYGRIAGDLYAFGWFIANYYDPWADLGDDGGPDYSSTLVYHMADSYAELGWYFQQ